MALCNKKLTTTDKIIIISYTVYSWLSIEDAQMSRFPFMLYSLSMHSLICTLPNFKCSYDYDYDYDYDY